MFKFVKYISGVALIATINYFAQDVALAGGGFSASCPRIAITPNGATLYADCYTQNQWLASSDLSLTSHIANDDGHSAADI